MGNKRKEQTKATWRILFLALLSLLVLFFLVSAVLVSVSFVSETAINWELIGLLFYSVVVMPVGTAFSFWLMFTIWFPICIWIFWHYFRFVSLLLPLPPLKRLRDAIHQGLLSDTTWMLSGGEGSFAHKIRSKLVASDAKVIRD
ncbi:hypothetical protein AKJ29_16175 [Aliiroseovarius crassostreae]|uniref:Uncharacterized protein n=2 Tax=Aliiroseovarius crassostreae TaxID=154981 RepID=A0A0P7IJQ3_9RHOB|nr:hypothetical protein [Aliiroseovarius crassostreae]KPN64183.1 hypothetical protein AKJ29_16175 [Aliiroseovarius crassostreae]